VTTRPDLSTLPVSKVAAPRCPAQIPEADHATPEAPALRSDDLPRARLLIVDDEPAQMHALCSTLQSARSSGK